MKVSGIWHKKTGPQTLSKPGFWYLERSGNPG